MCLQIRHGCDVGGASAREVQIEGPVNDCGDERRETLKTEMRLDDGWFQIAGVGRWNQRILAFVCFFASRGYGSEPTVCLDAGEARRDETITGGTWLAKSGGLVDSDIHLQLEVLTSLTRLHG